MVLSEAMARTHPKVTHSVEKNGGRESSMGLVWESLGSGLGYVLTGDLLLGKGFTSFVPQFSHLSVGDINSSSL